MLPGHSTALTITVCPCLCTATAAARAPPQPRHPQISAIASMVLALGILAPMLPLAPFGGALVPSQHTQRNAHRHNNSPMPQGSAPHQAGAQAAQLTSRKDADSIPQHVCLLHAVRGQHHHPLTLGGIQQVPYLAPGQDQQQGKAGVCSCKTHWAVHDCAVVQHGCSGRVNSHQPPAYRTAPDLKLQHSLAAMNVCRQ